MGFNSAFKGLKPERHAHVAPVSAQKRISKPQVFLCIPEYQIYYLQFFNYKI